MVKVVWNDNNGKIVGGIYDGRLVKIGRDSFYKESYIVYILMDTNWNQLNSSETNEGCKHELNEWLNLGESNES